MKYFNVLSEKGHPFSRAQLRVLLSLLYTAASVVLSSQGQPFFLNHFSIVRFEFFATLLQDSSSHGHLFSSN